LIDYLIYNTVDEIFINTIRLAFKNKKEKKCEQIIIMFAVISTFGPTISM